MVIEIHREYLPYGTNGWLYVNSEFLCHTIELPWKKNANRVSCIPEGEYSIIRRYSQKLLTHLEILNVPNRKKILFHPANYAVKELNGCIAPVSKITGEGMGSLSRNAFDKLKGMVCPRLSRGENVTLIIKSLNQSL